MLKCAIKFVENIRQHASSMWGLLIRTLRIFEPMTARHQPETDSSGTSMSHSDRVQLSWASVTANSPIPIEVVVDKANAQYILYNDCLQYLEAEYPGGSFACSTSQDIVRRPGFKLAHLHPSFGTLVNLLADNYPASDLALIPLEILRPTLQHNSVVDFILSGMLVTVTYTDHVACALRESPGATASDLYQALFLDCITRLWSFECRHRANTSYWSPMPWSRVSLQERDPSRLPGEQTFRTPALSENDLPDENSNGVRMARALVGSPTNIPWFGAPHDGYPFCDTLSEYTRIRRQVMNPSLRDDLSLWVSAMTFGVLEAATRSRIPESLLLTPAVLDEATTLSGDRILRFLSNWHDMLLTGRIHDDDDARVQHGRDVARLLDRALHALDEEFVQLTSMTIRTGYSPEDCTNIVGAVALTIAPLCSVAYRAWRELPEMNRLTETAHDNIRNLNTAAQAYCRKKMIATGWCPNTISRSFISSLWGVPILSNIVRLPPYIRRSLDEHKDCTESACVFYSIAPNAPYAQRHVNPACHCAHISPSLNDVANLLSDGLIPVVTFDGDVLCVRSAYDGAYISISHVWADGMGSTTDDGLPTCVVKRISGLVQQLLPGSGAFWMDSLCVPAAGSLRKRAINLMAQTYRGAAKVLVIDECIRLQCSENRPWEENLFRIATPGWVRRVWTLQEALLARELYFEFKEGPVDVEAGLGLKPSKVSNDPTDEPAANHSLNFQPSYSCDSHVPVLAFRAKSYASTQATSDIPLDDVIKLLRLRTTTKPEDELIAVSSILSCDVDALLSITGPDVAQRRMRAFLLQQGEVSRQFPMHVSPRLTLPKFTWAPCSLTSETEGASLSSGKGVCTVDGLTAEYFVASFQNPLRIPDEFMGGQDRSVFNTLVSHDSSMAIYTLRLHVQGLASDATNRSIDALLFLEGDLASAGSPIACAAVCHDELGEQPDEDKAGSSTYQTNAGDWRKSRKFVYVAPGRLHRTAMSSDSVVDVMPRLGELCKLMVQLA